MPLNVTATLSRIPEYRLKELDAIARDAGLPNWAAFLKEQASINPMGHSTYCPPSCRKDHYA